MSISSISFKANQMNTQNNTGVSSLPKYNIKNNSLNGLSQDTVCFKGKEEKTEYKNYSCKDADMLKYDLEYSKTSLFNRNYEIIGDDVELSVKNTLTSGQNIVGKAYDKDVNININSGTFGIRKGNAKGSVNNKEFDIKYQTNENSKNIKIAGDIEHLDDKEKALLIMLISDKIKHDLKVEEEMEMLVIASSL